MKTIKVICGKCYCSGNISAAVTSWICSGCRNSILINHNELKDPVEICPVCKLSYFYIEKNFSKLLGLLIIVIAITSFIILQAARPSGWNILIPAVFFVVDAIVYAASKYQTVCYNCLTEFKGFQINPEHKEYNLAIAARFTDKKQGS